MEYLKLQRAFRSSDAFGDADLAARGAWVSVAGYCADLENAGRIVGARLWSDRLWLLRSGCARADIDHLVASELASWAGDDLVVAGYDVIGEQHYQDKRDRAHDAGKASGASRRAASAERRSTWSEAHAQPHGSTEDEPNLNHTVEPNPNQTPTKPEPQVEPISISISTPMDTGVAEVSARARASPRPAPPSSESWEDRLHAILADHALATDRKSLREWRGHLRHVACVASVNEARVYLAWSTEVVRSQGLTHKYARHFDILGHEWNHGQREVEIERRRRAKAEADAVTAAIHEPASEGAEA